MTYAQELKQERGELLRLIREKAPEYRINGQRDKIKRLINNAKNNRSVLPKVGTPRNSKAKWWS